MAKTKQISISEYANKVDASKFRNNREHPNGKVTASAIKYRIKNNMTLPDVVKYIKVGKIHLLVVDANF